MPACAHNHFPLSTPDSVLDALDSIGLRGDGQPAGASTVAFPWFNTQRYWQDRILELREQIALMDEPPLVM